MRSLRLVVVISCSLASVLSGATPKTAPNVTYTAEGTFASPPVSGADQLKLAGEPFTINIVANAASVPIKHGSNWAVYSPFKMTGQVHSGLLGPTPIAIASAAASIQLAIGPDYDIFIAAFPVKVVGISLTVRATIDLPAGTLANLYIHPFSAVTLSATNTTVVYSNGTESTTLGIQNGSVGAAVPPTGGVVKAARQGANGTDGTEPGRAETLMRREEPNTKSFCC